jgi:hypothetical protein
MNKKNQDQLFTELLRNDAVAKPDHAIEDRLMYSFMLKNSSSKLRQNSFASFLGWIFSAQGLGLKTGLVSVVLFFSVMNSQLNFESGSIGASDSLFVKRVLVADSTHFNQVVDSLRNDSLN